MMNKEDINKVEQLILANFAKGIISPADYHLYEQLLKEVRLLNTVLDKVYEKSIKAKEELDSLLEDVEVGGFGYFNEVD